MQVYKDVKGNTISFERMEVSRLLHEIFVDFLGERGCKDRTRHDGLTQEHQKLKEEIARLIGLAFLTGQNKPENKEKINNIINKLTRRWSEAK